MIPEILLKDSVSIDYMIGVGLAGFFVLNYWDFMSGSGFMKIWKKMHSFSEIVLKLTITWRALCKWQILSIRPPRNFE